MKDLGRLLEGRRGVVAGVDRGPADHQANQPAPPPVAVTLTRRAKALGFPRASRPLRKHQPGSGEPADPTEAERLGAPRPVLPAPPPLQIPPNPPPAPAP